MPEADCWDFYKSQWGLTTPEFLAVCAEAVNAGFLFWQGPAFPDAVDVLSRLHGDFEIVVVTDRGFPGAEEACQEATKTWLEKVGIPYDELHFTREKDKIALDFMVDDRIENVEALAAAGVDAYLMERRHNFSSHIPRHRRVANWWEAEIRIREAARAVA